jgi:hypothetical protein
LVIVKVVEGNPSRVPVTETVLPDAGPAIVRLLSIVGAPVVRGFGDEVITFTIGWPF